MSLSSYAHALFRRLPHTPPSPSISGSSLSSASSLSLSESQEREGGSGGGSQSQSNSAWLGLGGGAGGSQGSIVGHGHGHEGRASSSGREGAAAAGLNSKAPRVGPQYQLESLSFSHFLDRLPASAAASSSSAADPILTQGGMIGGRLGLDALTAGAVEAAWADTAEREAFAAAFFAAPCDWARITAAVNAHAAAAAAAQALAGFAVGARPPVGARVRTVDEVLAFFFHVFQKTPAYERWLRRGEVPPQPQPHPLLQQLEQQQQPPSALLPIATATTTISPALPPSTPRPNIPPIATTTAAAADAHLRCSPPPTPATSSCASSIAIAAAAAVEEEEGKAAGLEELARAAAAAAAAASMAGEAAVGVPPLKRPKHRHGPAERQHEGAKDEEGTASAVVAAAFSPAPVAAEEEEGQEEEQQAAAATALSFEPDERFGDAFAMAFLKQPKRWRAVLAEMREAGVTGTVPEDPRVLREYYRSSFKDSTHYLSYLTSDDYRQWKAEQCRAVLPPNYHDESACYWEKCKDPVFATGDEIVCCATCPNAAHKRLQCSGRVHKNAHWLCEECRLKYKRAPAAAVNEAVAKVDQAVEVIERRRNAGLDLIVARACAAALPRIEAAGRRRAAEAGEEGMVGVGGKRGRGDGM